MFQNDHAMVQGPPENMQYWKFSGMNCASCTFLTTVEVVLHTIGVAVDPGSLVGRMLSSRHEMENAETSEALQDFHDLCTFMFRPIAEFGKANPPLTYDFHTQYHHLLGDSTRGDGDYTTAEDAFSCQRQRSATASQERHPVAMLACRNVDDLRADLRRYLAGVVGSVPALLHVDFGRHVSQISGSATAVPLTVVVDGVRGPTRADWVTTYAFAGAVCHGAGHYTGFYATAGNRIWDYDCNHGAPLGLLRSRPPLEPGAGMVSPLHAGVSIVYALYRVVSHLPRCEVVVPTEQSSNEKGECMPPTAALTPFTHKRSSLSQNSVSSADVPANISGPLPLSGTETNTTQPSKHTRMRKKARKRAKVKATAAAAELSLTLSRDSETTCAMCSTGCSSFYICLTCDGNLCSACMEYCHVSPDWEPFGAECPTTCVPCSISCLDGPPANTTIPGSSSGPPPSSRGCNSLTSGTSSSSYCSSSSSQSSGSTEAGSENIHPASITIPGSSSRLPASSGGCNSQTSATSSSPYCPGSSSQSSDSTVAGPVYLHPGRSIVSENLEFLEAATGRDGYRYGPAPTMEGVAETPLQAKAKMLAAMVLYHQTTSAHRIHGTGGDRPQYIYYQHAGRGHGGVDVTTVSPVSEYPECVEAHDAILRYAMKGVLQEHIDAKHARIVSSGFIVENVNTKESRGRSACDLESYRVQHLYTDDISGNQTVREPGEGRSDSTNRFPEWLQRESSGHPANTWGVDGLVSRRQGALGYVHVDNHGPNHLAAVNVIVTISQDGCTISFTVPSCYPFVRTLLLPCCILTLHPLPPSFGPSILPFDLASLAPFLPKSFLYTTRFFVDCDFICGDPMS